MRGSVRQFCYVSTHFRYILTTIVLIRNTLRRVAQSIFTFENAVVQKWHKEKRQKAPRQALTTYTILLALAQAKS